MGRQTKVRSGAFAGFVAEVLDEAGEDVRVRVDVFGRSTETVLARDQLDLDPVHDRLRRRIEADFAARNGHLEREYWLAREQVPSSDPLQDWKAFATARYEWTERLRREEETLRVAFERQLGALPDAEVESRFDAELEEWLPYRSTVTVAEENQQRAAHARLRGPVDAELAGDLAHRLGPLAARWSAAVTLLREWDAFDAQGVFPYNPDGSRKVFHVRLRAYAGASDAWRLVFENLEASRVAEGACNAIEVLGAEPGRARWVYRSMMRTRQRHRGGIFAGTDEADGEADWARMQSFVVELDGVVHTLHPTFEEIGNAAAGVTRDDYDRNETLDVDDLYAIAMRMLPCWLEDPPTQLGFDPEQGPWREVFADDGPRVIAHLAQDSASRPSTTAYYRSIATALVRGFDPG